MGRWENIVFEHRNKAFGAYELRMAYHKRLFVATILSVSAMAILLLLASYPFNTKQKEVFVELPTYDSLPEPFNLPAQQKGIAESKAEEEIAAPSQQEPTKELGSSSKGSMALPDVPSPSTPSSLSLNLSHGDSETGDSGGEYGNDSFNGGSPSSLFADGQIESHTGDPDYYQGAKYVHVDFKENLLIHYRDNTPKYIVPIIKEGSDGESRIIADMYWLLYNEYQGQFKEDISNPPGYTVHHWSQAYVRVHPEYIVNIGQIRWVHAQEIELTNNVRVPFSPLYLENLRTAMGHYARKFNYVSHGNMIATIKEHLPTPRAIRDAEREEQRIVHVAKKMVRRMRRDSVSGAPVVSESPQVLSRHLYALSMSMEKKTEVIITVPDIALSTMPPLFLDSISKVEQTEFNRPYGDPDYSISMTEVKTGRSLADLLQSRVPGLQVAGNKIFLRSTGVQVSKDEKGNTTYDAGLSLGKGSQEPLILLNGIPSSMEIVNTIPINLILNVDIVMGANSALYGSRGGFGVIAVFTRTQ